MRSILPCLVAALVASPAAAQSSRFALESRVERFAAARFGLPACLATARRASIAVGYAPANVQTFPGKLAIYAAGPRGGGASLTVYCIAVDTKTVSVVQAMDYARPQSAQAARVADAVNRALVTAAR